MPVTHIINISKAENIKVRVATQKWIRFVDMNCTLNATNTWIVRIYYTLYIQMCVLLCFRRCWPDPSDTVGRRDTFRTVIPINAGANSELPLARVLPLELELGYGRRVEDSGAQTPNPCWQVSWRTLCGRLRHIMHIIWERELGQVLSHYVLHFTAASHTCGLAKRHNNANVWGW